MFTDETRRRDFPTLEGITYLNSAAEGIPPLAVRDSLLAYFRDKQHGMDGRIPHAAEWDATKELVAHFYGLTAAEIGLCSCSSEAYNLAAMALNLQAGEEVVINDLDFPAGVSPWLQPSCQASVKLWRNRHGGLRTDDLIPLLGPKTRLVTVSLVSFYNGFTIDLPEVIATIRKHSPALIAVDVTQALGRIPLHLSDVDLIVSSTHKWILASHGGGLVGVPSARAAQWTVPAGGWYHLEDAFGANRFERAISKPGASSFSVGMRNIGVEAIDRQARPLVMHCLHELKSLPIELLTPIEPERIAGILAFKHPAADAIQKQLHAKNIHVMASAGRVRIAIHGYNTADDVEHFLRELRVALNEV
jgi:cysteine desulfurase / selenocysteine lyase